MSKVIVINKKEELEKILQANKYVVTDFSAEWCGPCKALAPVFDDLSNNVPDVTFVKIDVDQLKNVAEQYGISAIPTLIYFKDGQELPERTFGFIQKPKLMAKLTSLTTEK